MLTRLGQLTMPEEDLCVLPFVWLKLPCLTGRKDTYYSIPAH
jgi:hypothetical protein